MIARISGKLLNKGIDSVVIDVRGVGYELHIPLSTYYRLPEAGEMVSLETHTQHNDDSIKLYGFLTSVEKETFRLLISVSGVGPRLARNILSGIGAEELTNAISSANVDRLKSIPGIGGKTAERLILELKGKARISSPHEPSFAVNENGLRKDVISALVNLGYKAKQVENALPRANQDEQVDFETLFKRALKTVSSK